MKFRCSILLGVFLLSGSTMLTTAQGRRQQPLTVNESTPPVAARDYSALIREVFAPITDQLNLTTEQEFQIVAIITGAEVQSNPLAQKADELEQLLTESTLSDVPDEKTINRLSAEEAELLTRIIAMKARAKAGIYQVLSPAQRSLVAQQFRTTGARAEDLGGLSIYQ